MMSGENRAKLVSARISGCDNLPEFWAALDAVMLIKLRKMPSDHTANYGHKPYTLEMTPLEDSDGYAYDFTTWCPL